ncbi:MAG: 30S ribosomal protein S4 [Patescibacteria group bacterium]
MSRYLKPRTKLSKRVKRNLFLKGARSYSAKDDYAKRPFKAGMHNKKFAKKLSNFGSQLLEKQAIRFTYGITERQLGNLFKKAFTKQGDTGQFVITTLERRLDNVVYKGGLANSRAQARQLVTHGHFLVNGKKVNIPSYIVNAEDVITVKENKLKSQFWTDFKLEVPKDKAVWIDATKTKTLKVLSLPLETDLPQDFNLPPVVEYYSRKVG